MTSVNAWRQSCEFGETSSLRPSSRLAPSARLCRAPSSRLRPLRRRLAPRLPSVQLPMLWSSTGDVGRPPTARRRSLIDGGLPISGLLENRRQATRSRRKFVAVRQSPGRGDVTTQGVSAPRDPPVGLYLANRDFDQLLSIRADSTVARSQISHRSFPDAEVSPQ